ncbi:phage virion morphogenesis protein [Solimonas flava]|uniref:phage virion morphogenesis protein n=1 Tax=Solimonas flava TaxID=415849 RepID=UPI00040DAFAF|nr:phage virion morphogenesis protein [Solimonas flava]
MAATLQFDFRAAHEVEEFLQQLRGFDRAELLDGVGAIVEVQTQRRIKHEKESPDGEKWAEWSPAYKATRRGSQDYLQDTGSLFTSIAYYVEGDAVFVGEGMEYASFHQDGTRKMPARPSLGVSDANGEEITEEVVAFLDDVVQHTRLAR